MLKAEPGLYMEELKYQTKQQTLYFRKLFSGLVPEAVLE